MSLSLSFLSAERQEMLSYSFGERMLYYYYFPKYFFKQLVSMDEAETKIILIIIITIVINIINNLIVKNLIIKNI